MPRQKNAAAVALGKLGGKKGGKARAAALTPEQRSESARIAAERRAQQLSPRRRAEIARKAAAARWAKTK